MKTAKLFIVLMAASFLFISVVSGQQGPKLSGITADDSHPNGCVDCHAQRGDQDLRLGTGLKYNPKHPDMTGKVNVVPQDCAMCHQPGEEAGALSAISHKAHYKNPTQNKFIMYYQGECLACHRLDMSTGIMKMKNAPKNW